MKFQKLNIGLTIRFVCLAVFYFSFAFSCPLYCANLDENFFPDQGVPIDPEPLPWLEVKDKSVVYTDTDGNGRLDAGEIATIELVLMNNGKGIARDLILRSKVSGNSQDITVIPPIIPIIKPGKEVSLMTIVKAGMNLHSGKVLIKLSISEPSGLDTKPVEIAFDALSFQPPEVMAVDGIFTSGSRPVLMTNYPANLEVLLQNTGTGNAEEITAEIKLPEYVISLDQPHPPISRLRPGESIRLNTGFIVTTRYSAQEVPIKVTIHEKHAKYGSTNIFTAHLEQSLAMRVNVESEALRTDPVIPASLHSDVDRDIPVNNNRFANRYALVIGNEDYQRFQTGLQSDQNVAFARNDAITFKNYLVTMLGFPEKQVFLLVDGTRGQVSRELERVTELVKLNPKSELVFYYAGHGLPDMETHQGYLMPVDVTASDLKDGIRLGDLYAKLASSKADKITVFLDACFSGGGRGENGLLTARTVKIKPKGDVVEGNVVVFTATSDAEVSLPFNKQSHGLFTYYLLRKLKDSKGNINMKDLVDYLANEVPKASLLENGMKQTPQVLVAPDMGDAWRNWKF